MTNPDNYAKQIVKHQGKDQALRIAEGTQKSVVDTTSALYRFWTQVVNLVKKS